MQTPPSAPPKGTRTLWHPLFIATVRVALPDLCEILPEFPLTQGPQRADAVMVLLQHLARDHSLLPSIAENLGSHTLAELKGPTDVLDEWDYLILAGYGFQYEHLKRLDRADIHLMTVASRISKPFRRKVERHGGSFNLIEPGVYRVDGLPYRLCCIEAGLASERPGNGLLYLFSEEFLSEPRQVLGRLSPKEYDLFIWLCQNIRQMKRSVDPMEFKDFSVFNKSTEELLHDLLASLPPEERLQGLRPEERLQGLRPEERLQGLRPEELDALMRHLLQTQAHRR